MVKLKKGEDLGEYNSFIIFKINIINMPEKKRPENHTEYLERFKKLPIGSETRLPLSMLVPNQSDDGLEPVWNKGIVEACYDPGNGGQILIIHGHHTYYSLMSDAQTHATVRKITNPYFDF
jgi:hypothetical protein